MAVVEEWRLGSGEYVGDISALCLLTDPHRLSSLPYLIAGSGSQLLVYDLDLGKKIASLLVFQGVRVHGISCFPSRPPTIAVFGERRLKLFTPTFDNGVQFTMFQTLPKFGSWIFDVCYFQNKESHLAIGLSDNSVCVWDMSNSSVVLHVQSLEKSLLYSMRLWGDSLEALQIASGTIYNEIIVWKVVPQINGTHNSLQDCSLEYKAVHTCKLVGHEGSIFRLAWSSDGSKLVTASDDRSARVWDVNMGPENPDELCGSAGLVLFGHSARVWDCSIFDSLVVTAGEDCTCRVWGLDGKPLHVIKEHLGRGIWRCLYDPKFSLLITAGFDSSIKVHQLGNTSLPGSLGGHSEAISSNQNNIYTIRIPSLQYPTGLVDSKSEYVRCLRFTLEDSLYVATNHGLLYHAKLVDTGEVIWTEIVRIGEKVPIVCMDLLPKVFKTGCVNEDWIGVGDGKGNMTVVRVISEVCSPKVDITLTWSAGQERQLLGTYWCKPLGPSYIFTADPRGTLKLWRLCDDIQSFPRHVGECSNVSFIAEFTSSFGTRIMCLDASLQDEVLVCGDKRGNLILFPLLRSTLVGSDVSSHTKISPISHFKGAHGISSVTSVSVTRQLANPIDICSTGGDGCICYLECDRGGQHMEFTGMKQVKELSLIQTVLTDTNPVDELSSAHYAVGFTSVDFMILNLKTEAKILQISCGGWRRPHSYYVGDLPEANNCFAYVKDEVIHIHRNLVPESCWKMYSLNLHLQFHGRELHSLCFISKDSPTATNAKPGLFSGSSWIATGCEDGTVRLTRSTAGLEGWTESKLMGEHVGGSAVRSICYVSKMHMVSTQATAIADGSNVQFDGNECPFLLISVGAKRVLTSWLLRNSKTKHGEFENGNSSEGSSSMSFQWLSTDMPPKNSSTNQMVGVADITSSVNADGDDRCEKLQLKSCSRDKYEDDWRYMAVTAFLVKATGSRLTVCFVVVACSDATLVLRALVLPLRLWFDVALLGPLSSPVLALRHVIVPLCLLSKEYCGDGNVYIVFSGATDGSIALWDLTESVEAFTRRISALQVEKFIDCQKRPRTGRGSQGGRWWRSLGRYVTKNVETSAVTSDTPPNHETLSMEDDSGCDTTAQSETNPDNSPSKIYEIRPLRVLENIHQSGVNCLHISDERGYQNFDGGCVYNVVTGGDDQAIHSLVFALTASQDFETRTLLNKESVIGLGNEKNLDRFCQSQSREYKIILLYHDKVLSAHTSAVKGIWTDGSWVFSTGLDQRIRCWSLEEQGKLSEYACVIISVPEPEALDAKACSRGHYQIVVAGRGMQIAEFSTIGNLS